MSDKIGVAIITCNRPDMFSVCYDSLKSNPDIGEMIVVNDGADHEVFKNLECFYRHNGENRGVAASKNIGMQYLLDKGCDHIFVIEDDMFIKDPNIFQAYINASKKSGIQHFNFAQHGFANKIGDNMGNIVPNPKITVKYDNIGISFYQHCVGSFSYYSKKCLEEVGLMDERYYNACEHVDHTYEIIKKGYHPPFWWFADIENSWEYIGDDGWSIETSTICSSPFFMENVKKADNVFEEKHGHVPTQTPISSEDQFLKSLKHIRQIWTQHF